MTGWVVLAVVVAVIVALAVGGAVAARRRLEASRESFHDHLSQANVDLATAHAADRGWDPNALERAAGAALGQRLPALEKYEMTLVEVVDRPGVEEDVARYRARTPDGGEVLVTMARRGGTWVAESIES